MLVHVVGARPNFIKLAAICHQMNLCNIPHEIVHTGQHYDHKMSKVFFQDLDIPVPDVFLNIGSGTHAEQTGKTVIACEKLFQDKKYHLVLVYGDVNATLSAALAAQKIGIPVVHIESGLRSFDKTMPEEINRILTDHLSSYLFCSEPVCIDNLRNENIINNVFLVGNVMIDALLSVMPKVLASSLNYNDDKFGILTLHRPHNVDNESRYFSILKKVDELGIKIFYPVHPRVKDKISNLFFRNIEIINPLGYIDFVSLLNRSDFIITDSGGIQCECSVLGIKCITLRTATEHILTVIEGTNSLCSNIDDIEYFVSSPTKNAPKNKMWDGMAGDRIVKCLYSLKLV